MVVFDTFTSTSPGCTRGLPGNAAETSKGIGQLVGDAPASTAALRTPSSEILPSSEVHPAIASVPAIRTPPSIARLSITSGHATHPVAHAGERR